MGGFYTLIGALPSVEQKGGEAVPREPKSTDAMDHIKTGKGFGKAEKRNYAQMKHLEGLCTPPKDGLAPFLSDPSLLPKRPPSRRPEGE
jgi:hypothetical protein